MELEQQNDLITAIAAIDRGKLSVSGYQEKLDQLLGGISEDDRKSLAQEFTMRMNNWWKAQEGLEHRQPNPYAPVVYGYFHPSGAS